MDKKNIPDGSREATQPDKTGEILSLLKESGDAEISGCGREEIESLVEASLCLKGVEALDKAAAYGRVKSRIRATYGRRVLRYAAAVAIPLAIGVSVVFFAARGHKDAHDISNITAVSALPKLYLSDCSEVELGKEAGRPIVDPNYDISIVVSKENPVLSYNTPAAGGRNVSAEARHRIVVPRGGQWPVEFSDGTMVWINSDTELEYPVVFGDGAREVTVRGEAFFKVAKDSRRKFIVHMDGASVEVTGTSFGVSCYPGETVGVALETGSVIFSAGSGTVAVSAGEYASYDKGSDAVTVQQVDMKYYTMWRTGNVYFHNETVNEIIRILGRWYDVDFVLTDPMLGELRFSGAIHKDRPLAGFLKVLESTGSIRFSLSEARTILIENK